MTCTAIRDASPGNALLTAGDTWLSNTVAEIVSSQAYSNNGAIFVTWDEGEGGDGPIGMIVLSPLAKGAGIPTRSTTRTVPRC